MAPYWLSAFQAFWWTSFPSTGGVVVSHHTFSATLPILMDVGGRLEDPLHI